jgi:hypothetical protein
VNLFGVHNSSPRRGNAHGAQQLNLDKLHLDKLNPGNSIQTRLNRP